MSQRILSSRPDTSTTSESLDEGVNYRPCDLDRDRAAFWSLKTAFERELGAGEEAKADRYEEKLTERYRTRYLDWVERCVERDPDCVLVAETDAGLAGYVFLLPEELAFVWDAAVVNELFVREEHRGTGVADDLLERALDVARAQELPLDRVLLDVDADNERARAFYRRHGFAPWGELVAREL